jgi:hypothetical protein
MKMMLGCRCSTARSEPIMQIITAKIAKTFILIAGVSSSKHAVTIVAAIGYDLFF